MQNSRIAAAPSFDDAAGPSGTWLYEEPGSESAIHSAQRAGARGLGGGGRQQAAYVHEGVRCHTATKYENNASRRSAPAHARGKDDTVDEVRLQGGRGGFQCGTTGRCLSLSWACLRVARSVVRAQSLQHALPHVPCMKSHMLQIMFTGWGAVAIRSKSCARAASEKRVAHNQPTCDGGCYL